MNGVVWAVGSLFGDTNYHKLLLLLEFRQLYVEFWNYGLPV